MRATSFSSVGLFRRFIIVSPALTAVTAHYATQLALETAPAYPDSRVCRKVALTQLNLFVGIGLCLPCGGRGAVRRHSVGNHGSRRRDNHRRRPDNCED